MVENAEFISSELGYIPSEWRVAMLGDLCSKIQDGTHFSPILGGRDYLYVTSKNIRPGRLDLSTADWISKEEHRKIYRRCDTKRGDVLLTKDGANTGNAALNTLDVEVSLLSSVAFLRFDAHSDDPRFYLQQLLSDNGQARMRELMSGNAITRLTLQKIRSFKVVVPPLKEQEAIAEALSDTDAAIESLDALITKKQDVKRATMQRLLTGRTRLPGFTGEWETVRLEDFADCFDHLRVPLNESERLTRIGDYPYCGANGVLGFIDRYLIDDEMVLIAEDGGYFDEFATRPIAYKMSGKFWVNNHAHVLKAKPSKDNNYLYYSLVHKDVTPYLASGTRAKLNKSEMWKIEFRAPKSKTEQEAIAEVLTVMDDELEALTEQVSKLRMVKEGMMQDLLTGKVRLV